MATIPDAPGPEYGTIGWTHENGTIRVRLTGEIDMASREQAEKAVTAMGDAMPRDILIDVTEVTFFGSDGLRLLGDAIQIASDHGTQVTLWNPDQHLRHVVELVGMLDHIILTDE